DRHDSARDRFADRRNFYLNRHVRLTKRRKNARSNQTFHDRFRMRSFATSLTSDHRVYDIGDVAMVLGAVLQEYHCRGFNAFANQRIKQLRLPPFMSLIYPDGIARTIFVLIVDG